MPKEVYLTRVFRNCFIMLLVGALVILPAWSVSESSAGVTARAAIFSDSTRSKRLYSKNVNMRVAPASTTKVMTALLVLERLPLDKVITVSKRASLAPPTNIAAKPGERFRVRDLLYALLLKSANDVSITLAEAVSGSEWDFIQLMNQRARELGAKNTRFTNASGLPTKHMQYTTPYDMYLIFKEALKYKFFKTVIRHQRKNIVSLQGRRVQLVSHNKILFKDWRRKIYGKTGWTREAKSCFVGYFMNGKNVCIIAVFGCTKRWEDIKYIVSRYGHVSL